MQPRYYDQAFITQQWFVFKQGSTVLTMPVQGFAFGGFWKG